MSTLDLIRTLRHALAELRDAREPSAVTEVAWSLANELHANLATARPGGSLDLSTAAPDAAESELDQLREIGMAVFA